MVAPPAPPVGICKTIHSAVGGWATSTQIVRAKQIQCDRPFHQMRQVAALTDTIDLPSMNHPACPTQGVNRGHEAWQTQLNLLIKNNKGQGRENQPSMPVIFTLR